MNGPPPAPGGARVAWIGEWTYAHRGLHGAGATENSPAAFAAAIAAGLGIECDVRRSRDGQAIVFHDGELGRLTARPGSLAAYTAGELARMALPAGGTIPTLRQVLATTAGRVPLLIELKAGRERPVSPLCRAVYRDLQGYHGRHAVMSFDPRVGHWFARHSPATPRGLVITGTNARTIGSTVRRRIALWRARPDFLACDVRDLPSRFAAAQRRRGLPLAAWTVATEADAAACRDLADAAIAEGAGLQALLRDRPAGEREPGVAAGANSP